MTTTNDPKTKGLLPSGTRVLKLGTGQTGTIEEGHEQTGPEWSYLVDAGSGAEIWERDEFVLLPTPSPDSVLSEIARTVLGLDTLETRHSDSLDFSDQAVWQIRQALERAYAAGMKAGREGTP